MLIQKLLSVAQHGGNVVLYLLLGLSVFSFGIILDRFLYFRRKRFDLAMTSKELLARLDAGNIAGARELLAQSPTVEARVLEEALAWYERGSEAVAEVLGGGARKQRGEFESGLVFLGTLGNNAPFVGLFGTVLGIVTAFRELGQGNVGAMGNVMTGIAEALIATAVGIMVALPAVIAYNIFAKKAADIDENIAAIGSLVLAHMKARRQS